MIWAMTAGIWSHSFYVHAWYRDAKPRSVERIHAALKPGGLLVIEGFAGKQSFMFQPNE
jgi:hypothetical protein